MELKKSQPYQREKLKTGKGKAFSTLLGAMKEQQVEKIVAFGIGTAKEVWKKLARVNKRNSVFNKISLLEKFQSCSADLTNTISCYIIML